ncbi:MAG TPA: PP2C family protein-serine/threonine phosphatase [Streptosporangiaceae bacterium]|nr:PP2C family protein-serine/threonine phosphatase [Streptosporangiaceae bacterium]
MTSETVEVPASRPGTAAVPARAGSQGAPSRLPGPSRARDLEARLTAELAQERHIALELQRAILPLHDGPFELPGLRAVVRYLPATRGSRVGGDWYITAEMPTGQVLIAIGDVAGHGLAAAAGMARLRGALAGLAITGAAPDRLMGWLNDLVRHVAPEHTASVAAGYFDPATRVLTWAQAGHPPPVLVRGAWAAPLDPPDGILLGAGEDGYAVTSLRLRAGDVLLLYSDGLVERRDRSLDDGLATLARSARGVGDPEQVIAAALQALGSTDPEDDTCLVALQVL